jgi:hypothetical protein
MAHFDSSRLSWQPDQKGHKHHRQVIRQRARGRVDIASRKELKEIRGLGRPHELNIEIPRGDQANNTQKKIDYLLRCQLSTLLLLNTHPRSVPGKRPRVRLLVNHKDRRCHELISSSSINSYQRTSPHPAPNHSTPHERSPPAFL